MTGELRVVDADDERLRAHAQAVRRQVFVDEQGVPETLELDAHDARDANCVHVLAMIDQQPVGAARHRQTEAGHKLERVAVIASQRGTGIGEALVEHIHRQLPPDARTYVHAQQTAYGFWQRMGYSPEGAPFHEAGIEHQKMTRTPR